MNYLPGAYSQVGWSYKLFSFTIFKYISLDSFDYTGVQSFVIEKLWVVSGVIFDVESESQIRISLSRQDFEMIQVMCSKNGVFRYFWGYVQGARNFLGFFLKCHHLALLFPFKMSY